MVKPGLKFIKKDIQPLKRINHTILSTKMQSIKVDKTLHINESVTNLEENLLKILNEVACIKTINVHDRPLSSWMNSDINQKRKDYRKCQQIWLKDNYENNWNAAKRACNAYVKSLQLEKKKHFSEKVMEAKGNTKQLYSSINGLIDWLKDNPLPNVLDDKLANEFADFFYEKI